jgi:hypothetical protein
MDREVETDAIPAELDAAGLLVIDDGEVTPTRVPHD